METSAYNEYRPEIILQATVIRVIKHLLVANEQYCLTPQQISTLAHALFALQALPKFVSSLPYIFIEMQTVSQSTYHACSLTFDGDFIEITRSGYINNELGGDSYDDELVIIEPNSWGQLDLITCLPKLELWRDAFLYAHSTAALTIDSDIDWYCNDDLYEIDDA